MEFSFSSNIDDQRKRQGITTAAAKPAISNPVRPNIFSKPVQQPTTKVSSVYSENKPSKAFIQIEEEDSHSVSHLMQQSKHRYQQKLADETSKVIADNPLAYEYDTIYDDMKSEEQALRMASVAKKPSAADHRPQSRYIESMVLQTERRQREQTAAWEKMEKKERVREVETGQAAEGESFITEGYRKQMEISKQDAVATEVEEALNKKKTANAQDGMMNFYANLLTKNKAYSGIDTTNTESQLKEQQGAPIVVPKQSTRDKIEEKLRALKHRQEVQVEEERRRKKEDTAYDDDPFNIKKKVSPPRKSRSRSPEAKAQAVEDVKEKERLAKIAAVKARYQQRKSQVAAAAEDVDDSD